MSLNTHTHHTFHRLCCQGHPSLSRFSINRASTEPMRIPSCPATFCWSSMRMADMSMCSHSSYFHRTIPLPLTQPTFTSDLSCLSNAIVGFEVRLYNQKRLNIRMNRMLLLLSHCSITQYCSKSLCVMSYIIAPFLAYHTVCQSCLKSGEEVHIFIFCTCLHLALKCIGS